jgi:arginase
MQTTILASYSTRFHGPGMEEGPRAVLAALPPRAAEDVPFELDEQPAVALADGLPRLADAVERASGDGVPLLLLGECTLTPAVAGGLARRHPGLAVVWLDAHGDLNTPATTPSGFLGGMPFAIMLGWCHDELREAGGLDPAIGERSAALVGARDLDPGEAAAIDASDLVNVASVAEALAALPDDVPLYVHVDGDVLDPSEAPGVDFPAPGGWSVDRLITELETVAATGRVVAVSLCCGNPRRDPAGTGARAYARGLAPLID